MLSFSYGRFSALNFAFPVAYGNRKGNSNQNENREGWHMPIILVCKEKWVHVVSKQVQSQICLNQKKNTIRINGDVSLQELRIPQR